jgi:hypothetical protein
VKLFIYICLKNSLKLNLLFIYNKLYKILYISFKVNTENKINKDIKYTTKYKK